MLHKQLIILVQKAPNIINRVNILAFREIKVSEIIDRLWMVKAVAKPIVTNNKLNEHKHKACEPCMR